MGAGAVGFKVRARRGFGDGVEVVCGGVRGGFLVAIVWKPGRRRDGCWMRRKRRSLVECPVAEDVGDFEDVGADEDGVDAGVAGCVGRGMWADKLRMRVGLGGGAASDGVRSLRRKRRSLVECPVAEG